SSFWKSVSFFCAVACSSRKALFSPSRLASRALWLSTSLSLRTRLACITRTRKPSNRLNTRLTKTRILPTMVMSVPLDGVTVRRLRHSPLARLAAFPQAESASPIECGAGLWPATSFLSSPLWATGVFHLARRLRLLGTQLVNATQQEFLTVEDQLG